MEGVLVGFNSNSLSIIHSGLIEVGEPSGKWYEMHSMSRAPSAREKLLYAIML